MKKKVLAMLLGGVMAVGALSMQAPVTAEAAPVLEEDCGWQTEPHVESYEVGVVDGKLTVTITLKEFEGPTSEEAGFTMVALEKQLPSPIDWLDVNDEMIPLDWPDEMCLWAKRENGTYTFEGLPAGKTYYVYCTVYDHSWGPECTPTHDVICLGSGTPTVGPTPTTPGDTPVQDVPDSVPSVSRPSDPAREAETAMVNQIKSAEAGSTVTLDENVTTLSNSVMKELLKKGDVSLRLAFTYNEQDYVIVIPAGAALDNDIPWYGPLYLAQQYGNSAGAQTSEAVPAGGTYEVRRGDTLSRIAAAKNMTLKELLAKNPQIKDANKVIAGQKINW